MDNIFKKIPVNAGKEIFETILKMGKVRIERIVSTGQATPAGKWLSQTENEWVVLLKGSAEILFKDDGTRCKMVPGDHIYIRSRRRHRVEYTDLKCRTIWLAVHF